MAHPVAGVDDVCGLCGNLDLVEALFELLELRILPVLVALPEQDGAHDVIHGMPQERLDVERVSLHSIQSEKSSKNFHETF